MPMAKSYEIVKDFSFSPRGNVVLTFTKGQVRNNLTRACIEKGKSLNALKNVTEKEKD